MTRILITAAVASLIFSLVSAYHASAATRPIPTKLDTPQQVANVCTVERSGLLVCQVLYDNGKVVVVILEPTDPASSNWIER